jgi:hypothetical protein
MSNHFSTLFNKAEEIQESPEYEINKTETLDTSRFTTKLGSDDAKFKQIDSKPKLGDTQAREENELNIFKLFDLEWKHPFSFEIKNNLLKSCGGIEYLKTKSTFTSLLAKAPQIKTKSNVCLAGSGYYTVNKMIGKGSYAVIYTLSNNTETYALKVILSLCLLINLIKLKTLFFIEFFG